MYICESVKPDHLKELIQNN